MRKIGVLLFVLSLASLLNTVRASGFLIYEQGAAATARASAVVATIGDPTSIFYNPAGMGKLNGTNFYSGSTIILARSDFDSNDPRIDQHTQPHIPVLPTLYLTHRIIPDFSAGIGIYAPFGLATDWPKAWEGRYIATESRLQTIYTSVAFAYHPHPLFSIAVGFDYIQAEAKLERAIDFRAVGSPSLETGIIYRNQYQDGFSTLQAKGDGWGVNFGLQFGITEDFHIGLVYRQPIGSIRLSGSAKFDNIPQRSNVYPNEFAGDGTFLTNGLTLINLFRNTDATTHLQLPPVIQVGLATTIIKDLTLEVDLQWTGWSTVDEVRIKFARPVGGLPTFVPDGGINPINGLPSGTLSGPPQGIRSNGSDSSLQTITFGWEDSYTFRTGLEYKLSLMEEKDLALRLGWLYDWAPTRNEHLSPSLPDGDRMGISAGVGFKFSLFGFDNTIDLAYMAVLFEDVQKENLVGREDGGTANGEYRTLAHIISFGFTAEF